MISPQLTVQCHFKKTAPHRMERGSATIDHDFAYFMPRNSYSVHRYECTKENWDELPPCPYRDSALVIIDGSLTAVEGYHKSGGSNQLLTLRQWQWVEELPRMKTARAQTAVVNISDGEYVSVIGGCIGDGSHWTSYYSRTISSEE